MEGTIAKNVVRLESTIYIKYIWHNKKGKPMLYVQLKKRPYMGHYKWCYFSGGCYQTHL